MKARTFVGAAVFSAIFIGWSGLMSTSAWGQSEHTRRLIEGAKKEGKLLWYTALNVNDATMLTNRFEQLYPFIKTESLRLGQRDLMTKILLEANARVFRADVIEAVSIDGHILKKRGLLEKYISPEAGAYPSSVKDPDGTWTSFFINTHVTVFNTNLVKKDEVPRTYEELIQPKWKGKIVIRDDDFPTFGMMLRVMGKEKGLNFMRRLAAQGVELRSGSTLAIQDISAGAVPMGMNLYGTRVEELKKKGAPIDWLPMEFVLVSIEPLSVAAKAPNPNAARLFVDFLLSKEGQGLMRDRSRIPSRPDVPPDPPQLTQGLKLTATDLSLADEAEQIAKDYYEIFRIGK
jgi:iron(III) transport system substrate-binding protein